MNKTNSNIPQEVNDLIDRLYFLEHGAKTLESLERFDFKTNVYKIIFLSSQPPFKTAIAEFLKSIVLPIIKNTFVIFDKIISGILEKEKYGTPSPQQLAQMGYSFYQNRGHLPDKVLLGYEPVGLEDIIYAKDRFREELNFYTNYLGPLVTDFPIQAISKDKIRTNLSVDELAILFKILNDFDEGDKSKKVLQNYRVKRDLHRSVISCFTTTGKEEEITLNSYESKFGTTDQIEAVDYWIKKFSSLKASSSRLRMELIDKEDKPKKTTAKLIKKSN